MIYIMHICIGSSPILKQLIMISLHTVSHSKCVIKVAANLIKSCKMSTINQTFPPQPYCPQPAPLIYWISVPSVMEDQHHILGITQGSLYANAACLGMLYSSRHFDICLTSSKYQSIASGLRALEQSTRTGCCDVYRMLWTALYQPLQPAMICMNSMEKHITESKKKKRKGFKKIYIISMLRKGSEEQGNG